jgi:hypothetical protein
VIDAIRGLAKMAAFFTHRGNNLGSEQYNYIGLAEKVFS